MKLLHQDLFNIALEYSWCISKSNRPYLILKIIIAGSESCFLFVTFLDSYLVISIDEIELGKTSSLAKSI